MEISSRNISFIKEPKRIIILLSWNTANIYRKKGQKAAIRSIQGIKRRRH